MAGENDGVVFAKRADQLPDFQNLPGVEANGRLVQNDDLRVAQHRLGDSYPLAVALGQVLHQPVRHVQCPGLDHDLLQLGGNFLLRNALGPGDEAQVLPGRPVQIQRRLLREIPDAAFGLGGILEDVEAVDFHLPGGGGEAAGHDVHGGGFSRAVGAEKPVDLSRFHGKGQIVHGGVPAVALG